MVQIAVYDSDHLLKTVFYDRSNRKSREYTYGTADRIDSEKLDSGVNIAYTYDKLQRVTARSIGTTNKINTAYTFAASGRGSGYTTSKIARETIGGVQYDYTYDVLDNITKIVVTENGTSKTIDYVYDSWGCVKKIVDGNGNRITSIGHIGLLNPICYRGYYQDVETGFYYPLSFSNTHCNFLKNGV